MSDSDKILPESAGEDRTVPPTPSRELEPTVAPSASATRKANVAPTDLANYELLRELGRGGMGVVHQARDRKLDRIVALKTIIAGCFASEEDVGRFRQEAQAAAKLDHPGIVEIYEVSDVTSEQQFFSMKYVPGGSLADLKDEFANDTRRGVELMVKVVDAIHHAHQRGILHRDLKPANILVDDDDQPRVTDFGLAKHLHSDSDLTRTGAVMGTPGFMAPEQASGKSDVTTSADIYSLGAILYWMMAGRTPHQGETQLETIMKTIQQDPESIRSHCDDADRGLDLICQKALKNDPNDRYHSAEDFADDLRAWLAGEPLSVRPPTLFELISLWVRKNFRSIAIGISTGALCGALIGLNILVMICHETLSDENYFQQLGDSHEFWIAKYFHWTKDLPEWMIYLLGPAIVWLSVAFGYFNIRILKPDKREVVFAVGAIAALIAGIVSFTTSLGWSPIVRQGLEKGVQDIELISDSVWLETDQERQMARHALFQRYPGLKEVDVVQRGALIKSKILRDQFSGIPQGMWEGIGITLCLAVIPLFLSTVFSGMIWERGSRGFAHFGKTIEIGNYSALVLLISLKFFSMQVGANPGLLIQCLTLIGLGIGIYFAFQDSRWYWRVLGLVVVHIAFFGNMIESGNIVNANTIARRAQSDSELKRATNYLQRRVDQRNTNYDRYVLSVLYCYLGDDENYLKQCDKLVSGFENMHRPEVAERIAKVILLKPELHRDLSKAHELAESASVLAHASIYEKWFLFCRAISELRKSNFDEAIKWNADCRESFVIGDESKRNSRYLAAATYLVDALAYSKQDESQKAREAISKAKELLPPEVEYDFALSNRLYYLVLLREAERQVEGASE